jgi:hypothetical protein
MASLEYTAHVDSVREEDWNRLLVRFDDANIYQTWSYGAVRWGDRNLSHLVLYRGEEIVAMAQLRLLRVRPFDRGVAYLRWGPVCRLRGKQWDPEIVRAVATAMQQEYVVDRNLLLRVVPNAFTGSSLSETLESAFSQFAIPRSNGVVADRTFLIDLAPSLDELRKGLDQKWRNQLNRAEKNGLSIATGAGVEEYRRFLDLYRQMWSRKKFDTSVDVNEFALIQERLPLEQRMQVLICIQNGIPVAGIVCSAMGDSGIYLLGATSNDGLQAKGSYLLQWTFLQWLKNNGFRYYDLGGIDPEANPGVYHFKSGLSGRDVSRIRALDSCASVVSSGLVKAAEVMRSGVDGLGRFRGRISRLCSTQVKRAKAN